MRFCCVGPMRPYVRLILLCVFVESASSSLAMGRGRKRKLQDLDDVGAEAGIVSYHSVANYKGPRDLARQGGTIAKASRAYYAEKTWAMTQTTKLYGSLFKTLKGLAFAGGSAPTEAAAGETPTVHYVDPFALMEYFCTISVPFTAFVERWCTGEEAKPRVVMYHDDVRPGNVHLPGYARLYCIVYWTLSSFPDWFRNSDQGWFVLCIYPRKFIDCLVGGISAFFTALLGVFYPLQIGEPNMERTGVRVPNGRGGSLRFKAPYAGLIADDKALNETMESRGASSKRPCTRCLNLVGRCDENELIGTSLVHVTSADYERLVPQTPEGLASAWDEIHAAAGIINAADFEDLQIKRGVKYGPHGIQQSPLRAVAKFPRGAITDWMHDLVASGGIAQYEAGQFTRTVVSKSQITFDVIQRFSDCMRFGAGKRLDIQWDKRVKTKGKNKEKEKMALADGGECIRVVMVLQAFVQRYLQPRGLFEEECECLLLLARIIHLLKSGDKILGRLSLLLELIQKHHRLYKKLYPNCCKPKLHLLYHLAETFRYLIGNYSCFSPERKHRWSKRVANNTTKAFYKTLLIRLTRMACTSFKDPDHFKPIGGYQDAKPVKTSVYARLRKLGLRDSHDLLRSWTEIRLPSGHVRVNDVVQIGSDEFALALSLFSISEIIADRVENSFFCEAKVLHRMTPLCYSGAEDAVSKRIVSAGLLKGAATYFKQGDLYHIVRTPVLAEEL